jgi:hypothetical protein
MHDFRYYTTILSNTCNFLCTKVKKKFHCTKMDPLKERARGAGIEDFQIYTKWNQKGRHHVQPTHATTTHGMHSWEQNLMEG